jgi:AAA+ ATPase superfamily predicted ATPase
MLFDLAPKEEPRDFFNYEPEQSALAKFLADQRARMAVITGLRRTGKSSLMRVALKKAGTRHVIVDARGLASLNRKNFESAVFSGLKKIGGIGSRLLERIERVEAGVTLSLRNQEDIWSLLGRTSPVIAVDEAQMLRGTRVDDFLAAVHDNTKCKIILTGSEIGVLESFVGKDNPAAPLFGRDYREIKMHPLAPEKAREFLLAGFTQEKKSLPETQLGKALASLDGIVGWLALYGNLEAAGEKSALDKAVDRGSRLAYSEFETFLGNRLAAKGRYVSLMRAISRTENGWAELKRTLQAELREEISDQQFSGYLESLNEHGFVLKGADGAYSVPDPLLKHALRGGRTGFA